MNETRSTDARCIFSFNLNEQLMVLVQKMQNVRESSRRFTCTHYTSVTINVSDNFTLSSGIIQITI